MSPANDDDQREFDLEQQYLLRARDALNEMQDKADRMLAVGERSVREENTVDSRVIRSKLIARTESLKLGDQSLCFGRIDEDGMPSKAERWYIGRRHIESQDGEPLVVDWRAPVSIPFYRATAADSFELRLRRRFTCEGDELLALFDEDFSDPDSLRAAGIPDPLLAEIERDRSGQMEDIVSTIAAEQDLIIRSPLHECLLVQGGPGTGKTAVGLHRAAFLLFDHREKLAHDGVLVIGPNRVFLNYISNVLPSLGETAVTQATVQSLLDTRFRIRGSDTDEVAALKGDYRMSLVIQRAATQKIRNASEAASLPAGSRVVTLSIDEINLAQKTALDRNLPLNQCRGVYSDILLRESRRQLLERGLDLESAGPAMTAVQNSKEFNQLLARTWPNLSARSLVRSVLGNKSVRSQAADEILTAQEVALLHRKGAKKLDEELWSAADLMLLDEAEALCSGVRKQYGHIVVDEAQDLSSMALRAIGRRSKGASITVLGDVAQATAIGSQTSWTEVQSALGVPPKSVLTRELTVGYRVPGPILEMANQLLPVVAPSVTPSTSVREHGDRPQVILVGAEADLAMSTAEAVAALAGRWNSLGVIAPPQHFDEVLRHLQSTELNVADTRKALSLDAQVSVVEPLTAKGLEFDAVVVVEPAEIAELANGLRLLYVALTRSVQRLTIVRSRPLPPPL